MAPDRRRGRDAKEELKALKERLAAAPPRPKPATEPAARGKGAPAPTPARAEPPRAEPPREEPEAPQLTDEEAFAAAMAGVEPAPPGPVRVSVPKRSIAGESRRSREPRPPKGPRDEEAPPLDADDALFEASVREVLGAVRAVGRAREGRTPSRSLPVLDLHGFAEADAVPEARRILELHRQAGARHVKLIVGRGRHGDAVIRPAIERWLRTAPGVDDWRRGRPEEGGAGVIVVTLTRRDAR